MCVVRFQFGNIQTQACTQMHAHTYKHMHIQTHKYTYTCTRNDADINKDAHVCTLTIAHKYTHTHTTFTQPIIQVLMQVPNRPPMHSHSYIYRNHGGKCACDWVSLSLIVILSIHHDSCCFGNCETGDLEAVIIRMQKFLKPPPSCWAEWRTCKKDGNGARGGGGAPSNLSTHIATVLNYTCLSYCNV